MRAIDTNVLVFAEISSSQHHTKARALLTELAEGGHPWAIPWPCVYEFLRVVTHPRVFHPPVPLDRALSDLQGILGSPSLRLLQETPRHPQLMEEVLKSGGVAGNLIHDAHIAALCIEHGVSELLTGDRDFERFKGLKVTDPF
ncbi:MAG: PIN domain-containing protein [Longimicrobiales bacterium]|nr:PIN domain-containing protein [Longimicrobiales bacterium]